MIIETKFDEYSAQTKETISVVIPHYNNSGTLSRAIKSIKSQSVRPKEVIIVDDGSNDFHKKAIQRLEDSDISIIYHGVNKGAAAARNTGVERSIGDYIAFLDSDDYWLPGKLETQLEFMKRHDLDFSCTGYLILVDNCGPAQIRIPTDVNSIKDVVWGCAVSPGSTAMFRADLVDAIGLQDPNFRRLEDWDWLFQVVKHTKIKIVPIPTTAVNITSKPNKKTVNESIRKIFRKRYKDAFSDGFTSLLKFTSHTMIERAANQNNNNNFLYFLIFGFLSFCFWPRRDFSYYRRAISSVFKLQDTARNTVSKETQKENKKVLHFISSLDVGGAERMLVNLAIIESSKSPQKPNIVIVTLKGGGALEKFISQNNIEFISLNMNSFMTAPFAVFKLSKILKETRPDILKCWMYYCNVIGTLSTYLSGMRKRTKLIWGIRCSDMDFSQYSGRLRFSVALGALLSPFADKIISNSFAAIRIHSQLGFSSARWTVIDNGVDAERFRSSASLIEKMPSIRERHGIPENDFILCITARNDPMKGYDHLVKVTRDLPSVWVLAAGKNTQDIVAHDRFIGLGQVLDVRELLWQSDAFILPSLFGEGIPNALLEAMAAGLPVIASDVGDIARIVGSSGIVIPPGNDTKMREAILSLHKDAGWRSFLAKRAQDRIEGSFKLEASYDAFRRELR